MDKELFGIGKTWLGVYGLIALSAAMVFTGHIPVETFWQNALILLGIGGGKSGLKKIGEGLNRG